MHSPVGQTRHPHLTVQETPKQPHVSALVLFRYLAR